VILSVLCYLAVVDTQPLNGFKPDATIQKKYAMLEAKYDREMSPSKKDILIRVKEVFNPTRDRGYSDLAILIDLVIMIDNMMKQTMDETFAERVGQMQREAEFDQKESDLLKYVAGLSDETGFDDDALDQRDEVVRALLSEYANTKIEALKMSVNHLRSLGVDDKAFHDYIRLRENIRQTFKDMVDGIDSFKRRVDIEGFDSFEDIRKLMSETRRLAGEYEISPVKSMVLLTLPYSIVRKIDNTDGHYVSAYSPSLDTMYSIMSTSRNYYYPKTFVDSEALQEYVHYFQSNTDQATIETLTRIEVEDLRLIAHIYEPIMRDYQIDLSNEAIDRYTARRREKRYGMGVIPPAIAEGDEFNAVNRVGDTVQKIEGEVGRAVGMSARFEPIEITDEVLKI
jgi:hypothetical protein